MPVSNFICARTRGGMQVWCYWDLWFPIGPVVFFEGPPFSSKTGKGEWITYPIDFLITHSICILNSRPKAVPNHYLGPNMEDWRELSAPTESGARTCLLDARSVMHTSAHGAFSRGVSCTPWGHAWGPTAECYAHRGLGFAECHAHCLSWAASCALSRSVSGYNSSDPLRGPHRVQKVNTHTHLRNLLWSGA